MNPKSVGALQKISESILLLLAFILPVALHGRMFDATFIKDLTLQAAMAALAALCAWRYLELGRLEIPSSRAPWAAACAVCIAELGLSFAFNPLRELSFSPTLNLAGCLLAYFIALTEAASLSFAAALADWSLAGAAAVFALHAASFIEPGWSMQSAVGHRDLLGAFLGAVFPLGMARAMDQDNPLWRRAAALALGLACAAAELKAPSSSGLLTLCLGAGAFSALCLAFSKSAQQRLLGLAAAASVPCSLWAALTLDGARLEHDILWGWHYRSATAAAAWRLIAGHPWAGAGAGGFAAAAYPWARSAADAMPFLPSRCPSLPLRLASELGLPALALWAALPAGALILGLRDIRSRFASGEEREGALLAGLWSVVFALPVADWFSPVLSFTAPGLLFWLCSGCLLGLALERGAARVWAVPIPLGPAWRRAASALVALALVWALRWPAAILRSDLAFNRGYFERSRGGSEPGGWDQTLAHFEQVSAWHPYGWKARQFAAEIHLSYESPPNLDRALELYLQARALAPRSDADCGIGQAQQRAARWSEAAESYKRCLALRPDVLSAYPALADVSAILGRKEEALAAARAWLRVAPSDPAAWRLLADQYQERGRPRVARRMLNKAGKIEDVASAGRLNPIY